MWGEKLARGSYQWELLGILNPRLYKKGTESDSFINKGNNTDNIEDSNCQTLDYLYYDIIWILL